MAFNLAPFSDLSNALFKNFRFFLQNRKPLRRTSAPTANDDPEKLSNKLQPNLSIITQTFACYCCVLFNLARLLHLSSRFFENFPDFFQTRHLFNRTTRCKAKFNIHHFCRLSSAILKNLPNFLHHTPIFLLSPDEFHRRHIKSHLLKTAALPLNDANINLSAGSLPRL